MWAAWQVDGGADLIMIDCAFDSLNVKAAIYALEAVFHSRRRRLPVMVSPPHHGYPPLPPACLSWLASPPRHS